MHDSCFSLLHSERVTQMSSILSVAYFRRQHAGLGTEPWSRSRHTQPRGWLTPFQGLSNIKYLPFIFHGASRARNDID